MRGRCWLLLSLVLLLRLGCHLYPGDLIKQGLVSRTGPEGDTDAQVQGHSSSARVTGSRCFAGGGICENVRHTGKAALAASSLGTSGLRDSTSQLTSHPLEAQSGSGCTKLGG